MNAIDIDSLAGRLAKDLDATFPDVVRGLQDDVFSGALRMTRNRHTAEDITQEAFVRAYRALTTYDAERIESLRLRGWIWTIAANLCRNHARSRARKPAAGLTDDAVLAESRPGPEQLAVDAGTAADLASIVATLPWPQRAAVVLHHVVGLGYDDIAEALDRPLGTIKSDIHRGLARLRTLLEVPS